MDLLRITKTTFQILFNRKIIRLANLRKKWPIFKTSVNPTTQTMFTGSKITSIQIDQQLLDYLSYTQIIRFSQMLTLLCFSNPLPMEIYWLLIASKQKRNPLKPHVLKEHNFHQLLAWI